MLHGHPSHPTPGAGFERTSAAPLGTAAPAKRTILVPHESATADGRRACEGRTAPDGSFPFSFQPELFRAAPGGFSSLE